MRDALYTPERGEKPVHKPFEENQTKNDTHPMGITPLGDAVVRELVEWFGVRFSCSVAGWSDRKQSFVVGTGLGVDDLLRHWVKPGKITAIHAHATRKSRQVLVCFDIDEHHGQTDGGRAVDFLSVVFPSSWAENSPRGWHVLVLFDAGSLRCATFNRYLDAAGRALAEQLRERGITATLETKGHYALKEKPRGVSSGVRYRLPYPMDDADARALMNLRPVSESRLRELAGKASKTAVTSDAPAPTADHQPCAFKRAVAAKLAFNKHHGRDPQDPLELNRFYVEMYSTDEGNEKRLARFAYLLNHSHFDPSAASTEFSRMRQELEEAINRHVSDRTDPKYRFPLTTEDLTIALFTVTASAFSIADSPDRQYSCPNDSFAGMAAKLMQDGAVKRSLSNRNKIVAAKRILESAGLIETYDPGYRYGFTHLAGVGKKYVLGVNHPHRRRWLEFDAGVECRFLYQVHFPTEKLRCAA